MDASIGKVKKKLENMRTTYLRELKKVKQSLSSGADVYEPTLWYFDQFKFLGNTYEPCGSFSDDNSHADTTDPLKTEDTTMDSSDSEPSTSREIKTKNIDFKKKQKITVFKNHEHLSAPKPATMNNEDWEVMGRSIGLQLRDINKKQLTIATKLISDTIYFAKLNRLSEESHVEVGSGSLIAPVCSICAAQVDD